MEHMAYVVATVKPARVIMDQHFPYLPPPPRAPLLPDLPVIFFVLMIYETRFYCILFIEEEVLSKFILALNFICKIQNN
jgi:hypothetical protein